MDREREEQQQELRALRDEIGALRRRLQRMSPAAAPDPAPEAESEPERRFCQGDEPAPAGGGEAQLGRLELGLSFLSQGTGVRIKDYSLTRLELARGSGSGPQDGQRVLRKGHLAGQYHTVPFQLEFQLLETRSEESSSAVVTELSIILEHMEHGELSRFVARTEEKRDLFLFFRSLHFFLEWCEYRRQTFQYFQEKHPTMVQLPGGPAAEVMVLQSPRVPGFELVVVWRVHLDEEGKVTPELDLLTKIPEQALTLDKKEVVARTPRCFRTLLGLLGIEAALGSLVELLRMEE